MSEKLFDPADTSELSGFVGLAAERPARPASLNSLISTMENEPGLVPFKLQMIFNMQLISQAWQQTP